MEDAVEKTPSIQSLDIRIDGDANMPHVTLNGVDLRDNKIGLKSLKILWGTKEDEIPETLVQVEYMQTDDKGNLQEVMIAQSFPGSLLSK